MYSSSSQDFVLHSAIAAVSSTNFAGCFKVAEARQAAVRHNTEALQKLAIATKDPQSIPFGDTLLAIFLLALYEVSWILLRIKIPFSSPAVTLEPTSVYPFAHTTIFLI